MLEGNSVGVVIPAYRFCAPTPLYDRVSGRLPGAAGCSPRVAGFWPGANFENRPVAEVQDAIFARLSKGLNRLRSNPHLLHFETGHRLFENQPDR